MGLFYKGHKKVVNEFTKFDYSKRFTEKDAKECLKKLGIDLKEKKYTAEQFAQGMNVELEHGSHNKFTNVSNNDSLITAKITLAHLNEFPDYYDRLAIMELDAEKFWRDHDVFVCESEFDDFKFKKEDGIEAIKKLNIPWDKVQYNIEQVLIGINVELEHGTENELTNVTDDDLTKTTKIALAHLNKYPDYYMRLEVMEQEGEEYWKDREKENYIQEGIGISLEDTVETRKNLPPVKNKGINLANLKYYPLNEPNIKAYSNSFNSINHIRLTDEYEGLIMVYNKNPVGFINVNKETKCIQAFEINPEYRSQGFGERLLSHAIDTLHCDNLSVRKTNKAAISLYDKLGYKKYKETNHQYFMSLSGDAVKESSLLFNSLSTATDDGLIVLEGSTIKRYKCPYCEYRDEKENLIYHVQDEHEDMIPEGYSAARVVFNHINKKECGHCVICNRETPWDENTYKYKRMCGREECRKKAAAKAKENMKKVYGKEHLLDDPEYQNKMLKGRKISGTYNFKGENKEYVGTYEKNALEFMDKVLNCTPDEVQTPGPVIEYTYNGKKHFWITDIYYVTANLAIDCKDGGSNPNTREMKEYREKQIAKEKAITEQGKYNYLRLTDNDFEQLLLALVEIKKQMLDDEDKGTVIKINEYTAVGAMCNPIGRSYATYIVPYYVNNSFIGTGYCSNKFMSDLVILDDDSKLKKINPKEFIEKYKYKLLKSSSSNDVKEKINEALEKDEEVNVGFIYETITGNKFINPDQLYIDSNFKEELDFYSEFALELECKKYSLLEEFNEYIGKPNMSFECLNESSVGSISYREDINGYYLYNSENKRRSKYYESTDLIPKQLFGILRRDY